MNIATKYSLLLKSLYGLVQLGRNPKNTQMVFLIGNSQDTLADEYRKTGAIDDPFVQNPALVDLWQSNYHPPKYDIDALMELSDNTLGHQFAYSLKQNNIKGELYTGLISKHPMHYLRLRIRKTHDIWHVLTGFDISETGEMGLQGFYFGQFANGQSAFILAGGVLRALIKFDYAMVQRYIQAFVEGYNNGVAADNILSVKWEEGYWEQDIDKVRKEFGIKTVRMGREIVST